MIEVHDKSFSNRKFFSEDFSGQDLSKADFRYATLIDCKFVGCDLTEATFKNANCYGADFTDSIMFNTSFENAVLSRATFAPKSIFGVTVTLSCDTFDKMKVSRTVMLYWMYFATMFEAPDKEMQDRIVGSIGEKQYLALSKLFREQGNP